MTNSRTEVFDLYPYPAVRSALSFLRIITGIMTLAVLTSVLTSSALSQVKYKTLYGFTGSKDGSGPGAGLTFDATGNLYGTTENGGAYGDGVVFELTPTSGGGWEETVLHSFSGSDGSAPASASLIFDSAGNLYGTTHAGGTYGSGTVFELTSNGDGTWQESVLYSFNGTSGSAPIAGLIFDAAGNLFGTTSAGGTYNSGTVFQLTSSGNGSWNESVLYSFTGGADGSEPTAGLIFDASGNLYGATLVGGTGNGTIFELSQNNDGGWTESVLHTFSGKDGGYPWWGMVFDQAGSLFGSTWLGGTYDGGTVFRLTPNSDGVWEETVLYSFTTNGPAGVSLDSAGNLYSTTVRGGTNGYGTVFQLSKVNGVWTEKSYSFTDKPGAFPYAGVIFDATGNLYSTTFGDSTKTFGSVFEITR